MATKTYLELVNDVLIRLRETTVGNVSYSAYSVLIGKWINDAKRMAEDLWDWQALSTAKTVTLVASTQDYTIAGLNERARLEYQVDNPLHARAFDTTTGDPFELKEAPYQWIVDQRTLLAANPNNQAKPICFGVRKIAGGTAVGLYEVPTGARTWTFYFINPQDDLSGDSDVLTIPYTPVILIALDMALNERGEEIGEPGTTVQQRAYTHVANAVGIDALNQPHKTTFYPG